MNLLLQRFTTAFALGLSLLAAGCSGTQTADATPKTAAASLPGTRWDRGAVPVTDGMPPGSENVEPSALPEQERST
jgi:hypothetical protein